MPNSQECRDSNTKLRRRVCNGPRPRILTVARESGDETMKTLTTSCLPRKKSPPLNRLRCGHLQAKTLKVVLIHSQNNFWLFYFIIFFSSCSRCSEALQGSCLSTNTPPPNKKTKTQPKLPSPIEEHCSSVSDKISDTPGSQRSKSVAIECSNSERVHELGLGVTENALPSQSHLQPFVPPISEVAAPKYNWPHFLEGSYTPEISTHRCALTSG